MVFNPNARLNPRQVLDRRGVGGAGGIALGGGGIGVILLLAYLLLGGDPGALSGGSNPGFVTDQNGTELTEECQTGQDANERQDCRIVGFVNSIQDYWTDAFAQSGSDVPAGDTVLFDGGVNTACGAASSAIGPFYCPLDTHVYLDLGFYDELQQRFGAEGGPLAEGYVVAHEYGHHIQNLIGYRRGPERRRRRGYGGPHRAAGRLLRRRLGAQRRRHRVPAPADPSDIAQALDAAAAVGDDRIQERVQGQVTPETWTHGSSEQRQQWFLTGYEGGRVDDCDTFRADL